MLLCRPVWTVDVAHGGAGGVPGEESGTRPWLTSGRLANFRWFIPVDSSPLTCTSCRSVRGRVV